MPKTKTYHLTPKGHRLYWIHRDRTREELTPVEFVDQYICNAAPFNGECRSCGSYEKLCGGSFCVPCTRGAIAAP